VWLSGNLANPPPFSLIHSLWCRLRCPSAQSTAPRPRTATLSLLPHPLLRPGRLSLQFRNEENSSNSQTRKWFLFINDVVLDVVLIFRCFRCCFNSETRKVVSSQKHRKLMGVFSIVNHCRRCFRIRVQHSVLLHGPAACLLTLAYPHCRSTLLHQHRQPLPV